MVNRQGEPDPLPLSLVPPSLPSPPEMEFVPKQWRVVAAIVAYSICSGTMLLFNKLAMYYGESFLHNSQPYDLKKKGRELTPGFRSFGLCQYRSHLLSQ